MTVTAIIGLQWGDEGKGKIVDYLAQGASHIARFQGGHNAGHTIYHDEQKTVLHLLPSGALHPRANCYIGGGVVVSPPALIDEIAAIHAGGRDLRGRLFVARNAALVLPYHIRADKVRDMRDKIGTTGRGIGPAHEDKIARRATRFYDVVSAEGKEKTRANCEHYNRELEFFGQPSLRFDDLWDALQAQYKTLAPYLRDDIPQRLQAAAAGGEAVLLEGAQGALLDVELGAYPPYTTAASCLAAAHVGGLGADLSPRVLGVIKAYCTRVGNGPFPTELHDADGELLAARGGEVGATTGRARRCGWLDLPFLRHALRINGCKRLALTKLDVLDVLDSVPVCVAYRCGGRTLTEPPIDPTALADCRPVYESFDGWRDSPVADCRDSAALPSAALRLIRFIEAQCDCQVVILSTSPRRDAVITLAD